jgi:hypothetical protein
VAAASVVGRVRSLSIFQITVTAVGDRVLLVLFLRALPVQVAASATPSSPSNIVFRELKNKNQKLLLICTGDTALLGITTQFSYFKSEALSYIYH